LQRSVDRLYANYTIESPIGIRRAAELLASEQSIGSFGRVGGESDEIIDRFGARVESVEVLGSVDCATLPSAIPGLSSSTVYERGNVVISFPIHNFGENLPALAAVLLGNLFELQELTGVRLEDIQLPKDFERKFQPPRFGLAGTRQLTGVLDGPIIGTIIKPKLGLGPDATAALVTELTSAGIHFIKDDECMTNPAHAPLGERIRKIAPAIERAADRMGRKVMYAFNISDEPDTMRRNHDLVLANGGTCVMISLNACGFAAAAGLRRYSEVPIHGHRAGWGMLTRHPMLGMSFIAYQKLWRLAGVDQIHIGGLQSKFWEEDASVSASARACLEPLGSFSPIMPVLSSGQWGGQAAQTYQEIGCADVIYLAGGGILAHPGGAAAGVRAIADAWEAARRSIPLSEYAQSSPALRQSIETFGNLRSERGRVI
jgi:ribulose-bisphosphate carboxylase large chain